MGQEHQFESLVLLLDELDELMEVLCAYFPLCEQGADFL